VLAFELYLKNRDSKENPPKSLKPLKKIFYKNDVVIIDKKIIEEYGSDISEKFKDVQEWLAMPLTTSDASELNLPDFRTSPAQPNPYFEIYGNLKTNKSKESILILSLGKKPHNWECSMDLKSGNVSKKLDAIVRLKIDTQNYRFSKNNLHDEYVASGLIDKNGTVSKKSFEKIVTTFFEFAKKKPLENPRSGNWRFSVFILPLNDQIQFTPKAEAKPKQESESKNKSKIFTDSFGNSADEFASSSTKTAKFLSFDDRAFTLNCKKGQEFYKNIGIGKNSLDKIYFPLNQTFNISGMNWVFTNIDTSSHHKFKDTKRGIFSQLYENYKIMTRDSPHAREKAILKVICYKVTQAKQEILIDENLTMDKMKRLFSGIDEQKTPARAFEVLIETVGKSTLWNNYLYAIKNFLVETEIPKDYLLALFSKIVRQNIHNWLKTKNDSEQKEFFSKSDFCIKTLSTRFTSTYFMNFNEKFAYQVGQISRQYIDFKQKINEESNSLKDILTYSKYDREKLRFVLQRVGIGVNLAKADDRDISEITNKITMLQPKEEISDSEAQKDFSYFFYKGYYTDQEVLI